MKSYKVHLDLYIGLSHGVGAPHYSNRELRRLLKQSNLRSRPATFIPAIGLGAGDDEDIVVVQMIWPPLDCKDVALRCEELTDFLGRLFRQLHQRWVLLKFATMSDGVPVKMDSLELTRRRGPRVTAADLLPADVLPDSSAVAQSAAATRRRATRIVTALIPVPVERGESRDSSHERAVMTTAEELARQFGGGVLWRPGRNLAGAYWWREGIVERQDICLIEVDFPDHARNRAWLKKYVARTLLERFQQVAIPVQFIFLSGRTN